MIYITKYGTNLYCASRVLVERDTTGIGSETVQLVVGAFLHSNDPVHPAEAYLSPEQAYNKPIERLDWAHYPVSIQSALNGSIQDSLSSSGCPGNFECLDNYRDYFAVSARDKKRDLTLQ